MSNVIKFLEKGAKLTSLTDSTLNMVKGSNAKAGTQLIEMSGKRAFT